MKKMRTTMFITALCLTLSCVGYVGQLSMGSPKDVGMSPEKLERVRPAVQALVDEGKIAGATVVTVRKGRVVLFENFGMKDTAFHVPREKVDRFAVCYGPTAAGKLHVIDNPVESRYLEKPVLLSGGGGLVSTAADYLRFCQMLLNKGQLDGKRLLRPETVDMMTSDQLPEGVTRGPGEGFGLGFSVRTTDGKRPRGEYGWGGMASTHFWISPKDELIVVALSQHIPYSSQLEDAVKPRVYEAIVDGE